MHSSRMRTVSQQWPSLQGVLLPGVGGVCSLGWGVSAPGGQGVCSRGVSAPGGLLRGGCVCSFGGGGSALGGHGIPACTEADTSPPCGQTHACKNITFATSLRTVKILKMTITSW